jgi:hypothetical protein
MKHTFLMLLVALFAFTATAQPDPEKREARVNAYRIAVFTEILNLSEEEAQGFWPIYNDFQGKREQLQKQLRPAKDLDSMNDKEVEDFLKKFHDTRQQELDLEKELTQKLRKVLSVRKIAKIPNAEREFRERLVQKLRENREEKIERKQQRKNK